MTLKAVIGIDSVGKTSVGQSTDLMRLPSLNVIQTSSTPTAPSAGSDQLYFKADDGLYIQNSSSQENKISTVAIAAALAIALG